MDKRFMFSRFPFPSPAAPLQFCIEGAYTDDLSADFQHPVETDTDLGKLPACPDCNGTLASGELVFGAGARKCMMCGSVFRVAEVLA